LGFCQQWTPSIQKASVKKFKCQIGTVVHTWNLSTRKAEAERLTVQDQLGQVQASLGHIERTKESKVSLKETKEKKKGGTKPKCWVFWPPGINREMSACMNTGIQGGG
jgi:hypothetical protein